MYQGSKNLQCNNNKRPIIISCLLYCTPQVKTSSSVSDCPWRHPLLAHKHFGPQWLVKVRPCQRDASTYSHSQLDSCTTLHSPERVSPGSPLPAPSSWSSPFRTKSGGEMTTQETFKDLGCSSSEEDSNRADLADTPAEEKTSPVVRRHHPFSVEALMSGRKTDGRGEESTCGTPESGPVVLSPSGLNSLYMCRETCSPPRGSRKRFMASPSSPVKSETSESEDCAPWVTNSAFSAQPRKYTHDNTVWKNVWINHCYLTAHNVKV